ncbi:Type IIS restriction enzyme Eco57I [termite gut metagenome]|uniref:site-specific DNA-methyltransferase (adenine-specific) n=1 Tax=termite gut metagenome TaxID=433724 RepID=A0A5J4QIB6_9ZZZZ
MASLVKEYSQEKLFGQVYTPNFIVYKILDDIGYNTAEILGKKIIDPACGDGHFLMEIVKRIIQFSEIKNLKQNLECIYGWDVDSCAIKQCIANLNELIQDYAIYIDWNISITSSIKKYEKADLFSTYIDVPQFDFIVGNPPYIRIQHLDIKQRQYIQNNYSFCQSGSTDMYIAFYELCLNLLSKNGICGLITPNTFLFTETARPLRQYFASHKNLLQITNYGEIQLFDNATTYSAITIFNTKSNPNFIYQKALDKHRFDEIIIDFSELKEPFWQLTTDSIEKINGKKLKDICNIHVGITTLCDNVYIFPIIEIDEYFVYAETKLKRAVMIEKSILKPIIKGSKLKSSEQEIKEYILFPYQRINGKHAIIPENELKENYPFAYKYLLSVKSELDKRDNGKPNAVAWYAFGRSQGLDTSFGKKIIFSPMNSKPNFVYYNNPECTFYSGYCIKFNGNVDRLIFQLNSDRMENFISMSSRDFRGGWKAYNKKIIENFEVQI